MQVRVGVLAAYYTALPVHTFSFSHLFSWLILGACDLGFEWHLFKGSRRRRKLDSKMSKVWTAPIPHLEHIEWLNFLHSRAQTRSGLLRLLLSCWALDVVKPKCKQLQGLRSKLRRKSVLQRSLMHHTS